MKSKSPNQAKNKNTNTNINPQAEKSEENLFLNEFPAIKPKAIYVRQSKDKKDSLSIDTQIERCKRQLDHGELFEVFIDRGISAKNTDRPQFQQMLEKIKKDKFSSVIVYKLDRFSRNVADFMSIYEIFEKHDVKFISCNESFNTSTPMGKAMLAITAVFAQMERETIAERCKDMYWQRVENGLCTGGRVHFGFKKVPVVKDGVKTSMLEKDPQQAEIVQRIYQYYVKDMMSFADILTILNAEKPQKPFNPEGIKNVLKNGVYVKSDADVYDYLRRSGAVIRSDLSEFNGVNGFFTYNDPKKRKGKKFDSFCGENILIGMHEGIVDSETWLKSQRRIHEKRDYKRKGKSSRTWLSGLTVCGYCNHALTYSRGGGQNSPLYYGTCAGRRNKYCFEREKYVRADVLEIAVEKDLMQYLNKLPKIRAKKSIDEKAKIKALRNKLVNLKLREEDIEHIAKEYTKNGVFNLLKTLDNELSEIESEKENLQSQIYELESIIASDDVSEDEIKGYEQRFKDGDLEVKKKIAALIIDKIISTDDKLEICYKV